MPSRQEGIGTEVFCPLNRARKPNDGGMETGSDDSFWVATPAAL